MTKLSKRRQAISALVDKTKTYDVDEALILVKKCATAKFNESIDLAVKLGIDPRKSDQLVRGFVMLPEGNGKNIRIAVFAQGDKADAALEAGADIVGMEDLAQSIRSGNLDFDVLIAGPESMSIVGQLGSILGPKGLMPSPKAGTVTKDIVQATKNYKFGQSKYRTDKAGIIHCFIGKADFAEARLKSNLEAVVSSINAAKPSNSKGSYFRSMSLSSTMGVGIYVNYKDLLANLSKS